MSEWRSLFDGRTLEGWSATGNPEGWAVNDGCIHCRAQNGGYLYTEQTFEDFELTLRYLTKPGVNSGVFFRLSDVNAPVHTGMEIQILDTAGTENPGKHDSGALYDMKEPNGNVARPAGEWHDFRLVCDGPRIIVDQNGGRAVDVDINQWDTAGKNPDGTDNKFRYAWAQMPRRGHIALQDHNGEIWFKDLWIRC
jgi:hypothetical protein